jgi:hypothetical protein
MLSESETSVTHLTARPVVYSMMPEIFFVILSVSERLVTHLTDPLAVYPTIPKVHIVLPNYLVECEYNVCLLYSCRSQYQRVICRHLPIIIEKCRPLCILEVPGKDQDRSFFVKKPAGKCFKKGGILWKI